MILLDPDDRVLLLRYDDEPPNGRHWATPGGGLNPGETDAAAASRELTEETRGLERYVLRGEILRQVRTMGYGDRIVRQHERLFLARTDLACRELGDVAAMHASDGIVAWRWWTLAELDTTAEVVWPAGLAGADPPRAAPRLGRLRAPFVSEYREVKLGAPLALEQLVADQASFLPHA